MSHWRWPLTLYKLSTPASHYQPQCLSNLKSVRPSILQLSIGKRLTTTAEGPTDLLVKSNSPPPLQREA